MARYRISDLRVSWNKVGEFRINPAGDGGTEEAAETFAALPASRIGALLQVFAVRPLFWDGKAFVTDPLLPREEEDAGELDPTAPVRPLVVGWDCRIPVTGVIELSLSLAADPPQKVIEREGRPDEVTLPVRSSGSQASTRRWLKIDGAHELGLGAIIALLSSRYVRFEDGVLKNSDLVE